MRIICLKHLRIFFISSLILLFACTTKTEKLKNPLPRNPQKRFGVIVFAVGTIFRRVWSRLTNVQHFGLGIFKISREMGGRPTLRARCGRLARALPWRSSRGRLAPANHSKTSRIIRDRFPPAKTSLSKSLKHPKPTGNIPDTMGERSGGKIENTFFGVFLTIFIEKSRIFRDF